MKDLSIKAQAFILATISAGVFISAWFISQLVWEGLGFLALSALAALASAAQVLKVEGSTEKSSYNISWLVYGFTFVLLGAPAAMAIIVISHLVEWLWYRYPWYIQLFNIANYSLALAAAVLVYQFASTGIQLPLLAGAAAILGAVVAFTLTNHLLVGMVIKLARGQSFRQSGVFGLVTIMIDFSMLGMGAGAALIWMVNPYATFLSALPLYLIYRTLKVPALQRQTEIDPKTRLYNARYFAEESEKELSRADRFDRPLSLVMADLDLLRNINNSYGHTAGDVVLIGVAGILAKNARDYDIVARFGGEEFTLLLPETTEEEAFELIETIRQEIETTEFEVSTSVTPIKATMSFGITCRDRVDLSVSDIVHNADLALYHSKLSGRNMTSIFTDESITGLFPGESSQPVKADASDLQSRIDLSQMPYQPNLVREKKVFEQPPPDQNARPETDKPKGKDPGKTVPTKQPFPGWMTKAYVAVVALLAVFLLDCTFMYTNYFQVDWLALVVFALVILITEALSIEIYYRNTSISTATPIMIAGALLFGPVGAVVLSTTLAVTAMIKHSSPPHRFFFNLSNHLISTSISVAILALIGTSILDLPPFNQFAISVGAVMLSYLTSTGFVAVAMGLSMNKASHRIWGENFRWLWPFYLAYGVAACALILGYAYTGIFGVLVVLVPLFTLRFSQFQYIDHTKKIVRQLREKYTELEEQTTEISTLNEELLLTLANIVDLRDPYVYGHSQQVTRYAVLVAEEIGLTEDKLEDLRKAALLHDIGKVGIDDEILLKNGPLTKGEYEIVKQHAAEGAELVSTIHSLQQLAPMIRHHHERIDGLGYPDGLKGQEIPLEARILCLADSVEAMASDRPYRKALTQQEIIQEITVNSGKQFDPEIAAIFLKIIRKHDEPIIVNSARVLDLSERAQSLPIRYMESNGHSQSQGQNDDMHKVEVDRGQLN